MEDFKAKFSKGVSYLCGMFLSYLVFVMCLLIGQIFTIFFTSAIGYIVTGMLFLCIIYYGGFRDKKS